MKDNGNETAIQNLPIIRETRREVKEKLSEIEAIIVSKLSDVKDRKIEAYEKIIKDMEDRHKVQIMLLKNELKDEHLINMNLRQKNETLVRKLTAYETKMPML